MPGKQRTDPASQYGGTGPPGGGDTAGNAKLAAMIGVPDDYPGPAPNLGDVFRPGGLGNPAYPNARGGTGMVNTGVVVPTGQYQHPPMFQTGDDLALLQEMSVENVARLQGAMSQAGLIGPKTKFRAGVIDGTTRTAFKNLLTVANQNGTDYIQALKYLKNNPPTSTGEGAAAGIFGSTAAQQYDTTGSRTDTTTTNVTALDAEQLANRAYQDALGSNATPKQRKALRAALQAYADAHPQVSTTNSTYDPDTGRELTSNTSTTGGVDAAGLGQIAQDQAQAAPDYAEVQAATTYFNALSGALGPAV